jgi:hypothetical protein
MFGDKSYGSPPPVEPDPQNCLFPCPHCQRVLRFTFTGYECGHCGKVPYLELSTRAKVAHVLLCVFTVLFVYWLGVMVVGTLYIAIRYR